MKLETIKKLCCPHDLEDLTLTSIKNTPEGGVYEGYLHCGHCGRYYPIVKGIPILSPDEYREPSLEKPLLDQWIAHDKQIRS